MPKLLKSEPVIRLARRRSNGLPMNTVAPKLILALWCPALSISALEAPSIFHEPIANRSGQMVVWSGRGPLTVWPERDWSYILRAPGFDVIWDRPPLTSSELWSRYAGRTMRTDDNRWMASEVPKSWDEDRKKRFDLAWAKIAPLMETTTQETTAPKVLRAPSSKLQELYARRKQLLMAANE